MTVYIYSTSVNLTGATMSPATGDLISVEATGNLYSNSGTVVLVGAAVSGVQLLVEGDVLSGSASSAIIVSGASTQVFIESSGTVSSAGTAINMGSGVGNQLVNSGSVIGNEVAVDLSGSSITAQTSTQNFGIMSGTRHGVFVSGGTGYIENTGAITGGAAAGWTGQPDSYYFGNGVYQNWNALLNLFNTGTISGGNAGVHLNGMADTDNLANFISNTGTISGGIFGIGTNAFEAIGLFSTSLTLQNSGLIVGGSYGVEAGEMDIDNSGSIRGEKPGAGYGIVGSDIAINNSGEIFGSSYGISCSTLNLVNSGSIETSGGIGIQAGGASAYANIWNTGVITSYFAMLLGSSSDYVENSGTITGWVYLGGGDDVFVGTNGIVTGDVSGAEGNDTFYISDRNARVKEESFGGTDAVYSASNYTLLSGQEIERLVLTDSAERGNGNEFGNTIEGNGLNNQLAGREGADSITGGNGEDTLKGGSENDTLRGDADNDLLYGQTGNDSIDGGADEDQLFGQAGNDSMNGGAGSDTLQGGLGRDTLNGGTGVDADRFVYLTLSESALVSSGTADIITGFQTGVDQIDLSALDAKSATTTNDAFVFIGASAFSGTAGQLNYAISGAHVIVSGDVNGDSVADFQIQVNNLSSLLAGDFIL